MLVKNRYTDEAIGEFNISIGAHLIGADLSGAHLRGAHLIGADLRGADLSCADLSGAHLIGAHLSDADLSGADLSGADLSGAHLIGAHLIGAHLSDADLSGAHLSDADLRGADLSGADLSDATGVDYAIAITSILPDCGDVIGWKKCRNGVIVKLLISDGTPRSNATGRKCRAQSAVVLAVLGADYGISQYDDVTEYHVGKTVTCDEWNADRWTECGGGIHFFITRFEAEHYQ